MANKENFFKKIFEKGKGERRNERGRMMTTPIWENVIEGRLNEKKNSEALLWGR